MRAAAILGLGCSRKSLRPFQDDKAIDWRISVPGEADQADVILIFGGDGTVHRHLGQLVRLNLPILVVPAGSGNDFARALGLHRVRDSLAAWRKFCSGANNVRSIDVGTITPGEDPDGTPAPHEPARHRHTRYFCCVAGVGLDGEVARRANALPRWLRGHGGYVLSLAPAIIRCAPIPMKILTLKIAGTEMGVESNAAWEMRSDGPKILAAFANTPVYGGGMRIAPRARMDDGLLDVCVVGGVGAFKLFRMFPTVYSGRHLSIQEVEYFSTDRARVETEHPLDVYADGEYVCRTPFEVGVARATLQVVIP